MTPRALDGEDFHDQINMIPLIDVMLVLLVVFLITAPLMHSALSQSSNAAPARAAAQVVTTVVIDAQAQTWVDDRALSDAALAQRLQAPAEQAQLRIRADPRVAFAHVARVMALAQSAGWMNIAVMASEGS